MEGLESMGVNAVKSDKKAAWMYTIEGTSHGDLRGHKQVRVPMMYCPFSHACAYSVHGEYLLSGSSRVGGSGDYTPADTVLPIDFETPHVDLFDVSKNEM